MHWTKLFCRWADLGHCNHKCDERECASRSRFGLNKSTMKKAFEFQMPFYTSHQLTTAANYISNLHPLKYRSNTLTTTNTHGHQCITTLNTLQFIQGFHGNDCAGCANGVTN